MVIRDGGQMSLKAIAEATQVSAPSASTMVEKLQDMGLLTRNHAENDRRSVEIAITEKGITALNFTENCLLQGLVEILDGIGPEWASNWCDVYGKINTYIDGQESSL
jgi:DNA-binding MarR family transcriptional regulator